MHLAIGSSYHDAYTLDQMNVSAEQWKNLGFNDSAIHKDIVSTAPRTAIATLADGREVIIYADGRFTV